MSVTPSSFPSKRSDETELRAIDWALALPTDDSIATSVWSVSPSGLTLSSPLIEGTVTRIRVSSGSGGVTYQIKNAITTTQGFVLVEIVPISIVTSPF